MPAADRVRRAAGWIAPLLLFGLLAAWRGSTTEIGGGAWLDRGVEVARLWAQQGVGLLRSLSPVEDPRVAPAAVLLRLGLGPGGVASVFSALTLALGALTVFTLARGRARGAHALSAWLLAGSPLWIESCVGGDPHVALGTVFLLLSGGALPAAAAAIALAWAFGWSPWAWATLLLIPLGALLDREGRRTAVMVLASALVLCWALDPPALLHPARWFDAIRWQGRVLGLGSALVPFGASRGGWPALGALHLPALALILWAARGWPDRARRGDFGPLGFATALALALPAGVAHAAPILILLPWAAREAGVGFRDLAERWPPGRVVRLSAWALAALLVAPLIALGALRWTHTSSVREARGAALRQAEAVFAGGSLVGCDADLAPSDSSGLIWVTLPFHSLDPATFRGAYWPGWFGAFRGFVVSERTMGRYLEEPGAPREVLEFYLWLKRSAVRDHVAGSVPGRRMHVLELPPPSGPALEEGWRTRLRAGDAGGLPGGFIAALGGALIRCGSSGDGTLLLEEALAAGYRDVGLYLNLANGRMAAGRMTDAGQILEEALKAHPDDPLLLYNFGLVLVRVGYWERAMGVLGRLRQRWPRSADTAYLLGLALANGGHVEGGRRALNEALDLGLTGSRRQTCLEQLDRLREAAR
jgi:hypothetical protein